MNTTDQPLTRLSALLLAVLFGACATLPRTAAPPGTLVDPQATRETKALFANLRALSPEAVLFGHQDDLAYGVTWKREDGRSDVKAVTDAYPAVYGWELGDLELGATANLDDVRFDDMKRWIKEGYRRGGVSTVSWHMNHPVTGGNAWDRTPAVADILPGGAKHELLKQWLDRFADFAGSLEVGPLAWLGLGRPVPLLFRPYHELTGGWFWWGADQSTPDEYIALWRFTVEYLRDVKGVHNLLYAYSTDRFRDEAHYLERYPGDAYVDLLGVDNYGAMRSDEGIDELAAQLRTIVTLAEARGKLAAFTETGLEGIPEATWWTGRLLRAIKQDPVGQRIAYVLVWRNANEADNPGHHFAPYPGHTSAADFIRFYHDPLIHFGDTLPDLYR